jgi:hypothetical protein
MEGNRVRMEVLKQAVAAISGGWQKRSLKR